MKELSIEQKAKAYDNIIKKANKMHHENCEACQMCIEELIPELKESEDERMIQYFKDLAPFDKADELYEKYGFSHKDAIAWLEKQGEHARFREAIQVGDQVTKNEDGVLVNLSQLKRVAKPTLTKEKALKNSPFVEQKPTDKVEPKFKVGDWVVYCNDDVDLITGIEENGYSINNSGYIPFVCASDVRLWTIQDAKDGDVLVASDGSIFLFKGTIDYACKHYVALTTDDVVKFNEGLKHFWETSTAVHPATKEQRDLLFQKMHEAGYEWDADQRELKKIERSEENEAVLDALTRRLEGEDVYVSPHLAVKCLKSLKDRVQLQPKQKLSKEDADTLDFLIDYLGNEIKNTSPYGIIGGLDKAVVLLKAIKEGGVTLHLQAVYDKPVIEWGEEDKAIIDYLLQLINNSHKEPCTKGLIAFGAEAWLKSLKDKVQPQPMQQWSGGDEAHLHSLITHLEQWIESNPDTTGADIQGENIAWLKSLRPQNGWRPSDEQMKALKDALNDAICQYDFKGSLIKEEITRKHAETIESLYNDLKKL